MADLQAAVADCGLFAELYLGPQPQRLCPIGHGVQLATIWVRLASKSHIMGGLRRSRQRGSVPRGCRGRLPTVVAGLSVGPAVQRRPVRLRERGHALATLDGDTDSCERGVLGA